jgi:predicted LPLAT superfamily acyltransferase
MNNILVHTRHAKKYNRVVDEAGEEPMSRRVQVGDIGPEIAVDLMDRIAKGEWLSMAGDRASMSGPSRQCRVPFLGREAAFAQGPYILAALLKCPVYLFFLLKEESGYTVYVEKFADRIELPHRNRQQALAQYAARYAQALERYCRMAKLQWYNFYDYWA